MCMHCMHLCVARKVCSRVAPHVNERLEEVKKYRQSIEAQRRLVAASVLAGCLYYIVREELNVGG